MRTIYKYDIPQDLDEDGTFQLALPWAAEIVAFQIQGITPRLWAIVDTAEDTPTEKRTFYIVGTGHELPDKTLNYIGTVQDSIFVWHLFEEYVER